MSLRPIIPGQARGRGGEGTRRLWSEAPVRRPGMRRVRAIGAPSDIIVLRPTWAGGFPGDAYSIPVVGGSGCLADGSDSTYVRPTDTGTGTYDAVGTFPATACPDGFTPASMWLTLRARQVSGSPVLALDVAEDILDGIFYPSYVWARWDNADVAAGGTPFTGSWATWDSRVNYEWGVSTLVFPSVASIEAGLLQLRLNCYAAAGSLDVSDVTLTISSGEEPGGYPEK